MQWSIASVPLLVQPSPHSLDLLRVQIRMMGDDLFSILHQLSLQAQRCMPVAPLLIFPWKMLRKALFLTFHQFRYLELVHASRFHGVESSLFPPWSNSKKGVPF